MSLSQPTRREQLAARMTTLEELFTHFQRTVEDLDQVIRHLQKRMDTLEGKLGHLAETVQTVSEAARQDRPTEEER